MSKKTARSAKKQAKATPVSAPATAPLANQEDSKPKRGGKRAGAGRKPNLAKRLLKGFSRDVVAMAVQDIDVGGVIASLLKSKREKTRLETLIFVRDTIIGRPAQNVQLTGGLLHAHIYRPLASLTEEEVQTLDAITKKLTAPNASPDAPQIQADSKPAIDAGVLDSQVERMPS